MQHHFPCNFVSNCVGGEDEAGCWSGDGTCSPGTFQAGGRCFSLSRIEQQEVSWNLASNWCQQRGGQLPSLTTRRVWDAVTDLCHKTDKCNEFYIGARSAPPTISAMYQNSWIWSDGTIAHFIKLQTFKRSHYTSDTCTSFRTGFTFSLEFTGRQSLVVQECEETTQFVSCLLCEIPDALRPYKEEELPEIKATCVQQWERCNGQVDCDDGADENRCKTNVDYSKDTLDRELPLIMDLNAKGRFMFSPYKKDEYNTSTIFSCPDSHFTCVSLQQTGQITVDHSQMNEKGIVPQMSEGDGRTADIQIANVRKVSGIKNVRTNEGPAVAETVVWT
ncbi:uncharacterized protein LOC112555542 [Pomacea canaliculata]|uniref:uncharacterized protein LOC112555542 n=1 Tax=Pomacea canaliculata TaxID=400727 RepID=UPI000D73A1BE|nr:uncharacterized protein LOC112555542 [Pomacea canaliculata]